MPMTILAFTIIILLSERLVLNQSRQVDNRENNERKISQLFRLCSNITLEKRRNKNVKSVIVKYKASMTERIVK